MPTSDRGFHGAVDGGRGDMLNFRMCLPVSWRQRSVNSNCDHDMARVLCLIIVLVLCRSRIFEKLRLLRRRFRVIIDYREYKLGLGRMNIGTQTALAGQPANGRNKAGNKDKREKRNGIQSHDLMLY